MRIVVEEVVWPCTNAVCDAQVTPAEAKELGDNELCALKIFTVSPTVVRFVLYCNLTDEDIAATIKKLQYVIREFDAKA